MSNWRDAILRQLTNPAARLTLVADPDGLLREEGLLEGIRELGFSLLAFEDAVAFRYVYETQFRSHWDRGEAIGSGVIVHVQADDLSGLPYDLLQAGRRLAFNLGEIFPNLSYPVVVVLDRGDLDALYEAQHLYAPGQLGDNATKEFVLRHVFAIAPELIRQPPALLQLLLRRHYQGQKIPEQLEQRLIQLLRKNPDWAEWPLEILVTDREQFFSFLQERWPLFLNQLAAGGDFIGRETRVEPACGQLPGPAFLPFDHQDIRVYIDTLFIEGILQPVPHPQAAALVGTWAGVGVESNPGADRKQRWEKLLTRVADMIPGPTARHEAWLQFARGWAELIGLRCEEEEAGSEPDPRFREMQARVDGAFASWLCDRYAGLISLPPTPPVLLNQLPRFLARQLAAGQERIALLLVDGLALDQWGIVREELSRQRPGLRFREKAIFAWIPSITSVSRQALFAGKPPAFFPNSIQTTDREAAQWLQFWLDQGLAHNQIAYAKGLGEGKAAVLEELLAQTKLRVVGLVVDVVDKIMHGMELGTAGMHNQVRQWARQPFLAGGLDQLLERGFRVYLTSDHGNVEAEGWGRPSEGALANVRGERVRVFSDARLREQVQQRFPGSIAWLAVGLPGNYLPLIASGRKAFVREGTRIVTHGGISVEELIVPLVEIEGSES